MKRLSPLSFALAVMALWELASRTLVNPYFLPPPTAILARVATSLPGMWGHLGITLLEAILGAVLGAAVAIPLGYGVAKSPQIARIVEPYAAASQAIPAVAIAPLLALWLGYGYVPIIVLCAVMVFFPISLTTAYGVAHIHSDITDAA